MNLHPYVAGQLADHRMRELRHDADRHRRAASARGLRPTRRQRRGWLATTTAQGQE